MKNFEHAAEVLTVLMEERDLTAAELSRQTEVNAGTIRNLMTGRQTNISTRNLMTLARYFGMSMEEFIQKNSVDAGFHSFVTVDSHKIHKSRFDYT